MNIVDDVRRVGVIKMMMVDDMREGGVENDQKSDDVICGRPQSQFYVVNAQSSTCWFEYYLN